MAPISSIVDMGRTATNVLGAAEASLIVAAGEGLVDRSVYDGDDSYELKREGQASARRSVYAIASLRTPGAVWAPGELLLYSADYQPYLRRIFARQISPELLGWHD